MSDASPTIAYCNIEGCGGSGDDWDNSLGTDRGGNIDDELLFVDPENADYHVQPGSPCVDAGDPVETLIEDYRLATIRASLIGFDIIEISACIHPAHHSSLIGQFLSPHINQRPDEYGGSFSNRLKFPLEVIRTIKGYLPQEIMLSFHFTMPFSGMSKSDVLSAISLFKNAGIDLLSIGFPESSESDDEMIQLIEQIKLSIPDLPLILHGDFDVKSAESTLKKGQVDFIGFEKLIQEDYSFPQTLR